MKTATELREELKEAEKREKQNRLDEMAKVKPIMTYKVEVSDDKYHKIHDPAVIVYRISGTLVNKDEMKEAGHSVDRIGGGMDYYFNTLSGKIISRVGGGTLYIETFSPSQEADITRHHIEKFLKENPEGGDITPIVQWFQENKPKN